MKRCISIAVLAVLLCFPLGIAEGRAKLLTENGAEKILIKELQRRGIMKKGHIIMSEDSEEIGGEKFWFFRHAEDHPDHIATLNYYYVSAEDGAIYLYDLVEDELIPIDEAE